jgi:hypothetical protein
LRSDGTIPLSEQLLAPLKQANNLERADSRYYYIFNEAWRSQESKRIGGRLVLRDVSWFTLALFRFEIHQWADLSVAPPCWNCPTSIMLRERVRQRTVEEKLQQPFALWIAYVLSDTRHGVASLLGLSPRSQKQVPPPPSS